MMLGFVPRSPKLGCDSTVFGHDDNRVGAEQREDRYPLRFLFIAGDEPVDRKDKGELGVASRALADEVEVSQLRYLISPELESNGFRHAEAVDVEDSAAHTELR